MQYCKFCGAGLPAGAHFCGRCGRIGSTALEKPADISVLPSLSDSSPTAFTTISDPLPFVQGNDGENQDVRLNNEDEEKDEERRRLMGLPLLGVLASEGQAPVANVPVVQGTPQVGGVPRVEDGSAPQHVHFSTAHLHPHATSPQASAPQHIHSSTFHPHATSPQATAPQIIGHRRAHWHAGARTVRGGWLTITVTTVVIIAGVVSALAFLLPASISLSGSSTVNSGGTLHLHGAGFFPGSRVTLTLDNRLPLTVVAPGASEEASGGVTVDASMLQVLMADQSTSSGQTIQVNVSGSFDVTIAVSQSWSMGAHTIRATEYLSSLDVQSTAITFMIEPKPAPQQCPPGLIGTPPNCQQPAPQQCPPGQVGSPPNCQQPAPQQCPPGQVGSPPNCHQPAPQQCPPGQVGSPPNCQQPAPQQCPPGQVGSPPNCHQPAPQQCDPGLAGSPPDCYPCPQGTELQRHHCVDVAPPQCDPGLAGSPPDCYPCPQGTELYRYHCVDVAPPQCDPGLAGSSPDCNPQGPPSGPPPCSSSPDCNPQGPPSGPPPCSSPSDPQCVPPQ